MHLSEVEDCRVLKTLLTLLPADHRYHPYLVLGKDHATGQNTAMLTRIDPVSDVMRTEKRGSYPQKGSRCKGTSYGTIGVTKHYVAPIRIDNGKGEKLSFVFAGLHFWLVPMTSHVVHNGRLKLSSCAI